MLNFVASWKPGADKIFQKVDAQIVATEIYNIGDNPTAQQILEMARDENTETHKLIDWNDETAAQKYRIYQVRHLMCSLEIKQIGLNEKKGIQHIQVPIRMFHHLNGETGYRPTPVIMANADLHAKLLMTAKSELESFQRKYSNLEELEPVFEAIQKVM